MHQQNITNLYELLLVWNTVTNLVNHHINGYMVTYFFGLNKKMHSDECIYYIKLEEFHIFLWIVYCMLIAVFHLYQKHVIATFWWFRNNMMNKSYNNNRVWHTLTCGQKIYSVKLSYLIYSHSIVVIKSENSSTSLNICTFQSATSQYESTKFVFYVVKC